VQINIPIPAPVVGIDVSAYMKNGKIIFWMTMPDGKTSKILVFKPVSAELAAISFSSCELVGEASTHEDLQVLVAK
jgi:hypothetical protein